MSKLNICINSTSDIKIECHQVSLSIITSVVEANKIEQGSFECIVTEHKETENELKEAKKWIGKFIFGLTDKSCAL